MPHIYIYQKKHVVQAGLEGMTGMPRPSGSWELSWSPKALRHDPDHKHGAGEQGIFLEYSKAGDFSGLV